MKLLKTIKNLNPFRKPKKWFTSDLHFSHRNVIDYCDRPWKDVTEMNGALVKIWNDQVGPKDTVYVLGDFSLSAKAVDDYVPILNGYKVLVSGNHDHTFAWNGRVKPSKLARYLKAGWNEIHQKMTLTLKDGTEVLMSHLPYATEESMKYDTRYPELRPKNDGLFLLHGHLHAHYLKNGGCIDVGIDHKFQLWSEDEIVAMIHSGQDFIPSRLTGIHKGQKDETQDPA